MTEQKDKDTRYTYVTYPCAYVIDKITGEARKPNKEEQKRFDKALQRSMKRI